MNRQRQSLIHILRPYLSRLPKRPHVRGVLVAVATGRAPTTTKRASAMRGTV